MSPYSFTIDFREASSRYIEELQLKNVLVNLTFLPVADIIFEDLGIERKTIGDFFESVNDGRLFRQLRELKRNFRRQLLLIEGTGMRHGLIVVIRMVSILESLLVGRFRFYILLMVVRQRRFCMLLRVRNIRRLLVLIG